MLVLRSINLFLLQVHSGGIISFGQQLESSSSISFLQGQENATAGIVYFREVDKDSTLLVKLCNKLQGLLLTQRFCPSSMIIVTWVDIQQNSTEMV